MAPTNCSGSSTILFRAGYIHELLTLCRPSWVKRSMSSVPTKLAKMYRFSPETKFPTDVEAGVVAETALGPLFVGGSVGDSGHQKWFFQLGRVF